MYKLWKKALVVVIAICMPVICIQMAAQQMGSLQVRAEPGRAGVFLDGKYLGPAANLKMARTYDVAAGEHELVLREPRYEDVKMKVTIVAGKKTELKQAMNAKDMAKPPYGTLRITGFEKYAPVYLNGQFMGHADEFDASRQGLLLNPGDYDLKVTTPEGATLLEKKVSIRENAIEVAKRT